MENIENETNGDGALTRKERIELERNEKQKAKEHEIQIKKIKKAAPWALFVAVVVGGIYWVSTSADKNSSSGVRPGEEISIVSREHINVGDPHEPYNSNPPTSGPHAAPAEWGISPEEIPDENAIHNLEHGGIWISYKDLDEESLTSLKDITRRNRTSVVLSPREANDNTIAVASWGRLLKLDTVDEELINEFIKQNKNKSPEPLAR